MSDIVEQLKTLRRFLDGSGPLSGVHFGEGVLGGGAFWWRKHLKVIDEAAAENAALRTRLAEAGKVIIETSGMLDASIKRHRVREDHEPVTLVLNGERIGTFTYGEVLDRADAWLGAARAWKEASNG